MVLAEDVEGGRVVQLEGGVDGERLVPRVVGQEEVRRYVPFRGGGREINLFRHLQVNVHLQRHSHVAVSLLEVDDGALGEVERDLGHGDVVARLGARPPPRRTPRSRPGTRRPTNRAPRALIERVLGFSFMFKK